MDGLTRCIYCGLLQDAPAGVKECQRCGGELAFEDQAPSGHPDSYLQVQLELDQVQAPEGGNVDRYLLVTMRTPLEVPADQAAPQASGRSPIHFTPVLDISGSMQGEKLAQAKEAVRQSLRYLQDGDRISLVVFSQDVLSVLESTAFSDEVNRKVESILDEIRAGGMTALDGGLEMGVSNAIQDKPGTNLVLLLSDGQANVGETDLEKVGQRGLQAREQGLVISTLGVGRDYNEALMAEIATQGGGRFYHLQDASQIPIYLTGELGEAASICARETILELDLPPGAALIPLSAAYPAEQADGMVRVAIGSIPLDLELEIPLRLTLYAQADSTRLSVEGKVNYQSPAGNLLTSTLNRVTVRFVAADKFLQRQGVAVPVVEKVIHHRQAAYVLEHSRAVRKDPFKARTQATQDVKELREYASLVSDQEAEKMAKVLRDDYDAMAASPLQSKDRVSKAHGFIRSSKRYDDRE